MPRYPKIACVKYETKQRKTERKKKFALSGARTDPRLSARTTLEVPMETKLAISSVRVVVSGWPLKHFRLQQKTSKFAAVKIVVGITDAVSYCQILSQHCY